MAKSFKAKVRVNAVQHTLKSSGEISSVVLTMNPLDGQNGTENAEWSRWTPSGSVILNITNPDLFDVALPGDEFLVTFIPMAR
jgi:hypothetical protein